MLSRIAPRLSLLALAACSGAAQGADKPSVALDAKDTVWTAQTPEGQAIVLYTTADDVKVSLDTHLGNANGTITCRHHGLRRDAGSDIELELDADHAGSTSECAFALHSVFRCTPSKKSSKTQLVCNTSPTVIFDEASFDDVPPPETPYAVPSGKKQPTSAPTSTSAPNG